MLIASFVFFPFPSDFFRSTRSHGSLASAVRGESPMLSPRSRIIKSFCISPLSGEKSDGTPLSSFRRSPRKSAKRLIFTESTSDQQNDQVKKESINPRLVFDGENASDIQLNNRNCDIESPLCEGFKTPEKKRSSSVREDVYEASSLPSFPGLTPGSHKNRELNFRNVFSGQSASLMQNIPPDRASSSHNLSPVHSATLHSHPHFSSPDQAAKLRSSFLLSPKRKSPAKADSSFTSSIFETKARRSMSFKSPSKNSPSVSPSKKYHPSCSGEEGIVYSTPKKAASFSEKDIHSTPSKVTFSESCLISPSKVCSHPPSGQSLTPRRSILKNSPAFKTNLVNRIQEASLHSPLRKNQMTNPSNDKEESPSRIRKRKCRDFSEAESVSFQDPLKSETVSSNVENISGISGIKRRILSFDATASSSSNECSNHVHPNGVATTVVTVHTPSPTKKCKTPDVNKWMRKKRHSGSRNCSSSSSSPSLFSSPSSNECKSKGQNKESVTRNESADVDSKGTGCGNLPVKNENLSDYSNSSKKSPTREKCRKRNLFSPGDAPTSSQTGKEVLKNQQQGTVSKVQRISEKTSFRSSDQIEKKALPTINSGGFDPSQGTLAFTQDEEPLPSMSQNRQLRSNVSAQFVLEEKKLSDSMMPYLTRQTSSFGLESSQGFQVGVLPASPYRSQPQAIPSNLDSTSTVQTFQNQESERGSSNCLPEVACDQQPLFGSSPSQPAIMKTPTKTKKQFSPALSSSGLLQLIKSPLLDAGAKRNMLKTGKERKRKEKSRKN